MKNIKLRYICLLISLCVPFATQAQQNTASIDLAGSWNFQVDSLNVGIKEKWFLKNLNDKVSLPGSMTTNNKGNEVDVHTPWVGSIIDSGFFKKPEYAKYRKKGNIKVPFWLQPTKYYRGAAWYSKKVTVPANWKGKPAELYLERCHWETEVWVDGASAGTRNSLGTAHVYQLDKLLTPGEHTITIRVDNSARNINVGENSHSISDHTQSNWNGIVGKMALSVQPDAYIDNVQVYGDIHKKNASVQLVVVNALGKAQKVQVKLLATATKPGQTLQPVVKSITLTPGVNTVTLEYPMGSNPLLWSEFTPDYYTLSCNVTPAKGQADEKTTTFGMREFKASGTQFAINGSLTFLRGTLECAEFPKTGFPPTDLDSWMTILTKIKSYGLNHVRFHSWCPPDVAFQAADRLGLYFQIECSSWANQGAVIGDGTTLDQYIYEESENIVKSYGNHPSFCMMVYGNEPAGKNHIAYLTTFVKYWQKKDARRLYTTGAGWPVITESDYNSTSDPRIQRWGEGIKSIINANSPNTSYNWNEIIAPYKIPTVSHEIGQWCVYPDFEEIKQYDGVLKAKNFEIFRDQLHENGLGAFEKKFLMASGKLQALCYKADIEAALRTKGFAGFQLLGLYDFPGQGTALVGVLNPFWRDKGYITAAEYSRFCNTVVPLAKFKKMIFLNNEKLHADIEIAQFSAGTLKNTIPSWEVKNEKGAVLYSGKLAAKDIPVGNCIALGSIDQELNAVKEPSMLTLFVTVGEYTNQWEFFVYPATQPKVAEEVYVTQTMDDKAMKLLNKGGKVLLTLKQGSLLPEMGGDVAIGFSTIFWNTAWTSVQPPVTMGVLCNPANPALAEFPTQEYSNYQWWDAMSHSGAINLNKVTKGLEPIVRVVDDWVTARSLGLVFECKVGKGKLIVSGVDLITGAESRPEARQLLYSLKKYMAGTGFNPSQSLDVKSVIGLYKKE